MEEKEKKEIGQRIIARAQTSLYFLEDFLYRHSAKDGAYFRSILIMMSYSFELILKTSLILNTHYKNRKELEAELKNVNHDILKISKKLGKERLHELGIKNISPRNSSSFLGYCVETTDGSVFSIENFTDVRYDFLKDSLRDLEEDEIVKNSVKFLLSMSQILNKICWQ